MYNKGPKQGERKEYPPDIAIAYKNTAKSGQAYIKIIVKQDIPAGTELAMFPNSNKKERSHPDYNFRLSGERKEKSTRQAPAPKAPASNDEGGDGGFPF